MTRPAVTAKLGPVLMLVVIAALAGCSRNRIGSEVVAEAGRPVTTEGSSVGAPTSAAIASAEPEEQSSSTVAPGLVCLPPPAAATEVEFRPDWAVVGDRRLDLVIQKSQHPEASSTTPVALAAEPNPAGGWSFDWALEATSIDALGFEDTELLEQELAESIPSLRFAYVLDDARVWQGLTNGDEIRDAMDTIFGFIGELGDPAATQQAQAVFGSLSDEDLATVVAEDPMLYHTFEGLPLDVGDPLTFPDELPNAFGGEPFPATTTIQVLELADGDGCTVVEMAVRPEPDAFAAILEVTLREAFGLDEDQLDAMQAGFEVENRIVARFDHGTGLLVELEATQRISDGVVDRSETRIITDRGASGDGG